MPIDRKLWELPFNERHVPPWPCPHCHMGHFVVMKHSWKKGEEPRVLAVSMVDRETEKARRTQAHSYYDDTGVFGAIVQCTNCREVISACGTITSTENYDDDPREPFWEMLYQPLYFHPSLELFAIPPQCPDDVKKEIRAAFRVFFCDTSACLNHIRSAIELVLTEMGVKRYGGGRKKMPPPANPQGGAQLPKKSKRTLLSLSSRIDILRKTQPELAHSLHALRWLGNVASHGGDATREDAFDGFDLVEDVLQQRYVQRHKVIRRLAADIIRAKGRRSAKKP